jgi:heme-degrading monooxygenase HmoA
MATNKSTVSAADLKNLKDFNKEASSLTTVLKELADALGKNAKEAAKFTGESAAAYETSFSNAVSSAKELAGYTAKQLADTKKEAEFNKAVLKTEQDRARVQAKISELKDKQMHASAAEQPYIEKALKTLEDVDDAIASQLKHAEGLKKKYEEISKVDVFAPFKEMMGRIPYLNKALPEMTKASQAFRDSLAEGNSKMKSLGQGAKVLTNGLGQAALGGVLGASVDFFVQLDERSVALQHNLGVSSLEAYKMQDYMMRTSLATGKTWFNSERFLEAQNEVNKTLGSNGAISVDMAENFAALHHQMGLSTEEATQFSLASMNMGKNAKDYTASITVQTKLLNGQKKLQIDNREIIKGVAGTSSRVQLSFKASGQNLAQAVYQAKALGLNMAQVEKTADSLLDFESSIANELEAELLSGKEYNLEKARSYALTNNMVGLTTELKNQGITAASFGKMNRIEQESTAKMLGMSVDELGNSLTLQEQLKTVAKESGYRDAQSLEDLQKKVALKAREVDKNGKMLGYEEALNQIGDEKLRNQVDANTLAEQMQLKQTKALEKLAVAAGPDKLDKSVKLLNSGIDQLILAIKLLAAMQLVNTFRSVVKDVRSAGQFMKSMKGPGAGNVANQAAGPMTKAGKPDMRFSANKPGGGKGLFGKVGSFFGGIGDKIANSGVGKFVGKAAAGVKNVAGKLNPLKGAGDAVKGPLKAMGKFLGPIMSIASSIGSVYGDVTEARSQQATGQKVNTGDLGKRIVQGAAYPIINGAMNFIPGFGTAISIADGLLGAIGMSPLKWISDNLIDLVPTDMFSGLGKYALNPSGPAKETKKMATGGIVNGARNAIVGEAGPEAVVPLTAFYAKIDELIAAVKQGGNIYVNQQKLNESAGLNMYRLGDK